MKEEVINETPEEEYVDVMDMMDDHSDDIDDNLFGEF